MAQGALARLGSADEAADEAAGPGRVALAVREALVTAALALVLLTPLIGMQTTSGANGTTLIFHPLEVLAWVALAFVGRLAMLLLRRDRTAVKAPSKVATGLAT